MLQSLHLAPYLQRLAIVALVVGASCSSTSEPRQSPNNATVDFQTDSTTYLLSSDGQWYSGTIGVTYTNHTTGTANFVNCGGSSDVVLQKLVDGAWSTVWEPVMLLCASEPLVVLPGEQRHVKINVAAGYPGTNTEPQFSTSQISGIYRAMWTQVVTDYNNSGSSGVALPAEHRVSNQFAIAAPDR